MRTGTGRVRGPVPATAIRFLALHFFGTDGARPEVKENLPGATIDTEHSDDGPVASDVNRVGAMERRDFIG